MTEDCVAVSLMRTLEWRRRRGKGEMSFAGWRGEWVCWKRCQRKKGPHGVHAEPCFTQHAVAQTPWQELPCKVKKMQNYEHKEWVGLSFRIAWDWSRALLGFQTPHTAETAFTPAPNVSGWQRQWEIAIAVGFVWKWKAVLTAERRQIAKRLSLVVFRFQSSQ